jgi:RNA polymerase sigma factor (sigma-70 family)
VTITTLFLRKHRPSYYRRDPLDDLISDGCLGLMRAIARTEGRHPDAIFSYIWKLIRMTIRKGILERHEQYQNHYADERVHVMARARARLTQQFGRVPTPEELLAEVGSSIGNPQFYMDVPGVMHFSADEDGRLQAGNIADWREPSPDDKLLEADARRMAMKELKGSDKTIFALLMKGDCPADIARKMGVSRQRICQRLNGVLWEARCRVDLAAYLGVAPEESKPTLRKSKFPAISSLPPARKVG